MNEKTYYLFNPGVLERKDNTLKFTPVAEGGEALSTDAQSRYLPVEDIADFMCSVVCVPIVRCLIFWVRRILQSISLIITRTIQVRLCLVTDCYPDGCCWRRRRTIRIKRSG